MGDRRERRLRRARRARIGVATGLGVALAAAAVVLATSTIGTHREAAAGAATPDPGSERASTTTTSTLPATTTTTRPAVNPAYPPAPAGSGAGRRIVYCNSCQRVWLMDDDQYAFASYTVSGRRGTPRAGTYHVFRKLENGSSHGLRLPWFVGFAYGRTTDIGFHGIPLRRNGSPIQSDDQLGTPHSAGCIREHQFTAKMLWDWAPIGTTVVVTP